MITIPFDHIMGLWEEARSKSSFINQSVLISYTKQIEDQDPFTFFQNSEKYFPGQRFFWSNPDHSHIIVGAGITQEFTVKDDENRYQSIEKQWKRFIEEAVCKYEVEEVGPVIFGGFSFDPKKEKTSLWSQFSDALFILPTFMLTILKGKTFITINYLSDFNKLHLQNLVATEEDLLKPISVKQLSTTSIVKCVEMDPSEWKQSISNVTKRISEGVMDKVVLAREMRVLFDNDINVLPVLEHLMEEQSNSYIYTFERGNDCFLGATPEQLVKKDGKNVQSMCLAGSIARGEDVLEDEEYGQTLLQDEKNIHEHELVVKMIRASLEEVCSQVHTPDRPSLYKMKHIQHLHTPVKAITTENKSITDFVKLLHPTPALGGFPQDVAMETIREVEKLDRGWYAGPLGWMDYKQDGEFIVSIRSGLLQAREASLFAGCGVVEDSDPESEYKETQIKFKPMLSALGGNPSK
ncbi:isochorismate synthase [Sutcliffiella rhizosphaerae]|uniref:Isochorismate synthase MenF n=1 Tax=Sutcliffiella rhizosphaerae TaxID=2880967 RepID=A0ABM8YRB8_9BACI|nr:isochorismate synthase [Sutcliffiella rhizosphaerae]CAG9622398.1 Salicylate biosynthesis isochorismate synthase [Sutcliffiella rhizosphaerae]